MAITKSKKITYILLLLAFSLVPFGQLWGALFQQLFSTTFRLHPLDILLVTIFLFNLPFLVRKTNSKLKFVVISIIFSYLWGVYLFGFNFTSLLYLLRFVSVISIYHIATFLDPKKVLNTVYYISIFSALIGWVQYLMMPDMRGMYLFGWDDHYYRMVGSFFDPAFLGIILVVGLLVAVYLNKSLYFQLFLVLSLALTYSRASYLALFVGLFILVVLIKEIKIKLKGVAVLLILLSLLPVLPRPGGYGVKLTRTHSAVAKIENFDYSLDLISKSPLLGYGFNNICALKQQINLENGNACHGLDNSYLFMLATMGVPVSLVLIDFYVSIYLNSLNKYKKLLLSLFAAVGVHSLFTNTLFYIPILFILMLIASSLKGDKSRGE